MNFKVVNIFSTFRLKDIWLPVLVCVFTLSMFLIIFLHSYFNPLIIDNLSLAYERAIKPEDRGLLFQSVTGYSNGSVFLTIKNEGNYSVVIKDIMLKQSGDTLAKKSINNEIFPHTSDNFFTVLFTEKLQHGDTYYIEVLTQRGSYIGKIPIGAQTTTNSYFTIEK